MEFFKLLFFLQLLGLYFLALLFCPDFDFTTEQQMNPLTASLFFSLVQKVNKIDPNTYHYPLPQGTALHGKLFSFKMSVLVARLILCS